MYGLFCLVLWTPALLAGQPATEKKEDKDEKQKVTVFSSVDLKFWGRVVMNVHYDTDDIRGDTDFATYVTGEGKEEVNFNGRDTRLGFSASSEAGDWDAGLVAEIDFYGSNAGNSLIPRMRLGYVKIADKNGLSFRLGQDWIPIGQQNPGTIDFGILAWGGNLWWRVPQLTVRKKVGKFEYLGSLMKHRVSSSQENQEDMPWVLGRVQWADGGKLLALGLGARSVEVDGYDYSPFMAVLEFKTPLGSKAAINGELWTGAGIGREFIRYGLDYNSSAGTEIESEGGFISLNLKAGPGAFNLGIGLDDPDDGDALAGAYTGATFLENQVLFANYQGKLGKNFGYGFEIMDIDTIQISGATFSANRFTLSFSYVF
jgi:hypothetical protein